MINKKLFEKVASSGILPNEQQALLLKACLTDGNEAISNFEKWFASYSFPKYSCSDSNIGLPPMYDQLDGGSQRLLSLLYKNQSNAGNNHPVIKMLQGYYKYVWYRNQLLKNQYQQITKAFQSNNIQSIVFKGIGLSEKYYKDYGTRPTADIDLLVKKEDWKESISVLESIGWVSKFGDPYGTTNSLLNAHTFKNGELEVDLHFHVSHYDFSDQTKNLIWEKSQVGLNEFQFLPKSVELLVTFLHGLQSNVIPPVRWVADSVMILKTFTTTDWEAFISLVEKEQNATIISIAINYLKNHEFYEVPAEIISRVDQLNTSKINLRYFSLVGLRRNPNDFKTTLFSLYKIVSLNNWNPGKIIVDMSTHCKYLWAVESNGQLLTMLFKRIIDKVIYPARVYKKNVS